jgi:hypothetical protein
MGGFICWPLLEYLIPNTKKGSKKYLWWTQSHQQSARMNYQKSLPSLDGAKQAFQ